MDSERARVDPKLVGSMKESVMEPGLRLLWYHLDSCVARTGKTRDENGEDDNCSSDEGMSGQSVVA